MSGTRKTLVLVAVALLCLVGLALVNQAHVREFGAPVGLAAVVTGRA